MAEDAFKRTAHLEEFLCGHLGERLLHFLDVGFFFRDGGGRVAARALDLLKEGEAFLGVLELRLIERLLFVGVEVVGFTRELGLPCGDALGGVLPAELLVKRDAGLLALLFCRDAGRETKEFGFRGGGFPGFVEEGGVVRVSGGEAVLELGRVARRKLRFYVRYLAGVGGFGFRLPAVSVVLDPREETGELRLLLTAVDAGVFFERLDFFELTLDDFFALPVLHLYLPELFRAPLAEGGKGDFGSLFLRVLGDLGEPLEGPA